MTETHYKLARYPMVVDHKAMTITVNGKVFDKPDLHRRKEFDFDFKAEICGFPDWPREQRAWSKFYAEMLGCKFNWRFFGTNYHLWISSKMTQRTSNLLRHEGRHWKHFDTDLVSRTHAVLPYVNEAERDGLFNLIPAIIFFGKSPQAIRAEVGRGAWRRIANNSVTRNKLLMNAARRCERFTPNPAGFADLLEVPSGVMREINSGSADELMAARVATRKRPQEFRLAMHAVHDTRRMLGREFNPEWGMARIVREHEAATRAIMQRRYSDKRFADDWSFEESGFCATLITSQAEIAVEGETQHHCVASYARSAADGGYAVFKIDGKERATAGVRNGRVDQVYAACNSPVSKECGAFARKVAAKYAEYVGAIAKAA